MINRDDMKYVPVFMAKNLVKNIGKADFALTGEQPSIADGTPGDRLIVMTTTTAIYTFDFADSENPIVRIMPNPLFTGAVVTTSPKPSYKPIDASEN